MSSGDSDDRPTDDSAASNSEAETSDTAADASDEASGGEAEEVERSPATAPGMPVERMEEIGDIEELVEIVRSEDPEKARIVLASFVAELQWQGPLPPPNFLARYNDVYDGCGRDIVRMAQSQSSHRQTLEATNLERDHQHRSRGQTYGFIVAMTVILGGIGLIAIGKSTSGLVAILATLVSLVGAFAYSRIGQRRDLQAKREAFEGSGRQAAVRGATRE